MKYIVLLNQVAIGGRFPIAFLVVIVLMFVAMGWLIWHWSKTGIVTIDLLKMMFGFLLLIVVSGLAIMTLTLAEDAKNDTQIDQILTMLSVMGGAFVNWAFSVGSRNGEKK